MAEWKIIDANYLRALELESFLRADPLNRVVLNEYVMESYKGNALENIRRSVEILRRHPLQVVVLKGAMEIISLQSVRPTKREDFIDNDQTREFRKFCDCVQLAAAGDKLLASQVSSHGEAATLQLDRIRKDAPLFAQGIGELALLLGPEFCRQLRQHERPDGGDVLIVKRAMELAVLFFETHLSVERIPDSSSELFNTFIFRYSLLGCLLAVRWISDGGWKSVKQERITNDLVDINYAVYATFFDGLLTHDRKCLDLFEEAQMFLDAIAEP